MVIDASVLVSLLFPEDAYHSASRTFLEAAEERGEVVVAPSIALPEVAGAISRRTRQPLTARRALRTLLRLPHVRIVAVDVELAEEAAGIAADHGLRGADAVYVATARQLAVPLVTWDRDQAKRAASVIDAGPPAL